jgi:hypothetical protein
MNHPEVTKLNASQYYAKRLKEAEDYRQARKFTSRQPAGAFLSALRKYLPVWQSQPASGSVQSQSG